MKIMVNDNIDEYKDDFYKGLTFRQTLFAGLAVMAVLVAVLLAGVLRGYSDPADSEAKKELYALVQKMCNEFKEREGSLICRELLGLREGEDLPEPAARTEEYYQSRPCVGACRAAAEIADKYLLGHDAE